MHQLRTIVTTSRPLCSLASFYCDLAAARASHAAPAGLSRPFVSASLVSSTQQACCEPSPGLYNLYNNAKSSSSFVSTPAHSSSHSSRGFAAQSASRLKQSVNRAKRLAQQQYGGRGGPLTEQTDPTSNESVATVPQEQTTVEANQGQASQLQVQSRCCLHYKPVLLLMILYVVKTV